MQSKEYLKEEIKMGGPGSGRRKTGLTTSGREYYNMMRDSMKQHTRLQKHLKEKQQIIDKIKMFEKLSKLTKRK